MSKNQNPPMPFKKHGMNKGEKAKNSRETGKRLLGYLFEYKKKFAVIFFLIVIVALFSAIATRLIGVAVDRFAYNEGSKSFYNVLIIMVILYALISVFTWLENKLVMDVSQRAVAKIRADIFDKLQNLPLKYFDSKPTGEIMSRITNDVDNISNTLNQGLAQFLSSVLTIIFAFVAMLVLSPTLTIVTSVSIPIMLILIKFVTSNSKKHFSARQEKLGKLNGYIEEVISGQKVVKVFNREEEEIEEFKVINKDLVYSSVKSEIFSGAIAPLSTAVNNMIYAFIAGVGGVMIIAGLPMTVGTISSFLTFSRQFTRPINEIASLANMIMAALAGAERVFEIIDEPSETIDSYGAYELNNVMGRVDLCNVDFSYNEKTPVLKDVTLYAKPGQTIAFVGPTGAGKTTIINLLTRFYDIQGGSILIDNHNIMDIKRESLRKTLGIVLQDTYLFTGTIEDNIKYGRLDATFEEIKEAAKLANANEFIKRLPDGYKTELSDGGSNLSQGQRQMISIARAILSNPRILILDEATSSVDTRTEMKIQDAMRNLMKGRTNFVIAHRLSTIRDADLIAVINEGRIVEKGNHEELLEEKGFYYNLYMSQFELQLA